MIAFLDAQEVFFPNFNDKNKSKKWRKFAILRVLKYFFLKQIVKDLGCLVLNDRANVVLSLK